MVASFLRQLEDTTWPAPEGELREGGDENVILNSTVHKFSREQTSALHVSLFLITICSSLKKTVLQKTKLQ